VRGFGDGLERLTSMSEKRYGCLPAEASFLKNRGCGNLVVLTEAGDAEAEAKVDEEDEEDEEAGPVFECGLARDKPIEW
jgi:hypothetical protein